MPKKMQGFLMTQKALIFYRHNKLNNRSLNKKLKLKNKKNWLA